MKIKLLIVFLVFNVHFASSQDATFSITKLKVLDVKRSTTSDFEKADATTLMSTNSSSSSSLTKTEGTLSVSLTGGATYNIPIKVPPGINGIQPEISLTYNSQGGNGLAGYGWNLSGISVITRTPATKFHDGFIAPVDLNADDRFSFDGQRLLLKSGTYGGEGAVYQTENYSNVKIESFGSYYSGPQYFKVSYPDGSVAYYGQTSNSRSRMDYAITYWENPQGVRISYEYTSSNNSLSISKITYGSKAGNTPINEIQFEYVTRKRPEQSFVGGVRFIRKNILKKIKVFGNGIGYRNYVLTHDYNLLGYNRVIKVQEFSGDNT
ncbi:MAG TPA: SpvB/TcaC N-terminal domain-containing protein [Salinimicrobium sp.]|nr:SpvB/TcaC N-terminal domain-containing protein [Salinimicrobium sp.]